MFATIVFCVYVALLLFLAIGGWAVFHGICKDDSERQR